MPATVKREKNGRYPPGENGGAHGKKGRSGRKPSEFKDWCRRLTEDEIARKVYEARNQAGDLEVMKFGAAYAHGKPTDKTEVTGDIKIHVEYDD